MKKIMLFLFALVLLGCSVKEENSYKENSNIQQGTLIIYDNQGKKWIVRVIDGCEYLIKDIYNQGYVSHKGNCNNPIHQYNIKEEKYD